MQSYQHFTLLERESLSEKIREGKSFRQIAREMGRNVSNISREYNRNQNKDGSYHPWRATVLYICRRKLCVRKPRLDDEKARDFVTRALEQFWSPEIISERWKMEHPTIPLAHATIYRSIKRKHLDGITAKTHLRRRGKRKNVHNTKVIYPTHTIHDRPEEANMRARFGDLEGDTVYGAIGKGSLVTLVDRASRQLYAVSIPNRESDTVKTAFAAALDGVDVKSITLDNGSEFAKFPEIEEQHKTTVYFADPHSPWQRGSNENINGLLRFFYPKGTNFLLVDHDELQKIVNLINHRPRKCLGWLSPFEFISKKCCS